MDITSRRFTVIVHIIFWVVYFLLNGATYSRFAGLSDVYEKILLAGAVHMSYAYFHLLVLLPKLFFKRKFSLYLLVMVPLFYVAVFLLVLLENIWLRGRGDFITFFSWTGFVNAFISTFIVLSLTALLKFLQEWYMQQERNREYAINQLTAEHKMLRMQVNPHFLFNALNNIYSLAYKKSEAAAPAILKLAELMRYLLYDSEERKVSLQTEVDYIKNYIGLQRLKYGDTEKIRFHSENISSAMIDPLLFIPFVENAFKHGNLADENAFIDINIRLESNTLELKVVNTYDSEDKVRDKAGGIGIDNVRNRLEAHYPGKHQLDLDDDGGLYSVRLRIEL